MATIQDLCFYIVYGHSAISFSATDSDNRYRELSEIIRKQHSNHKVIM